MTTAATTATIHSNTTTAATSLTNATTTTTILTNTTTLPILTTEPYDAEGAMKFTVAVVLVFGIGVIGLLGIYHCRSLKEDLSDKEADEFVKRFERRRCNLEKQYHKNIMLGLVSSIITKTMRAEAQSRSRYGTRPFLRPTLSEPSLLQAQSPLCDWQEAQEQQRRQRQGSQRHKSGHALLVRDVLNILQAGAATKELMRKTFTLVAAQDPTSCSASGLDSRARAARDDARSPAPRLKKPPLAVRHSTAGVELPDLRLESGLKATGLLNVPGHGVPSSVSSKPGKVEGHERRTTLTVPTIVVDSPGHYTPCADSFNAGGNESDSSAPYAVAFSAGGNDSDSSAPCAVSFIAGGNESDSSAPYTVSFEVGGNESDSSAPCAVSFEVGGNDSDSSAPCAVSFNAGGNESDSSAPCAVSFNAGGNESDSSATCAVSFKVGGNESDSSAPYTVSFNAGGNESDSA